MLLMDTDEMDTDVAAQLAALSTREIIDALGATSSPAIVRTLLELAARIPSVRLGRSLAHFDACVESVGIAHAARDILARLGASVVVDGDRPSSGPALVIVNHPGAYDALALMAAIGRDDVALLATDRAFLRAMPHLRRHLVFAVTEGGALERARSGREALAWLSRGGALVQFGAGAIEPDARFSPSAPLAEWKTGTGLLARRARRLGATILPTFVSGVHSPRAKRLPFVRWAERRDVTTIAPLVQAALPGFRDVTVTVRFGTSFDDSTLRDPLDDDARAAALRDAVSALRRPTAPRAHDVRQPAYTDRARVVRS